MDLLLMQIRVSLCYPEEKNTHGDLKVGAKLVVSVQNFVKGLT